VLVEAPHLHVRNRPAAAVELGRPLSCRRSVALRALQRIDNDSPAGGLVFRFSVHALPRRGRLPGPAGVAMRPGRTGVLSAVEATP